MTHTNPPTKTTDLPDGYRLTELGPLPEDWRVVKLGEVIYPERQKIYWKHYRGDIPIIEKIPFDTGEIVTRKKRETKTDLYMPGPRALLITSKINFHQGAVAILKQQVCATTHFEFYALEDQADAEYLWRYLRTEEFKRHFARDIKFRGFKKEANYKFIKNIVVPLPPLPEQRAIAHVLRAVQEAKEATERVIAAARELKKSLMRHLFTYGPVPVDQTDAVEMQETEIGPLPAHWRVVRLGEVANTTSGGTPRRDVPGFYEGRIPWLKSGELDDCEVYATEEHITEKGLQQSNAKIFPPGTLLIAMYGATAGKAGILRIESATNQAICAIFPKQKGVWLEEFLFYALIYFRNRLLSQRYGGAQPNLSQRIIRNLPIPLPPLSEQQEIARMLQAVDEKIRAEEGRKQALEALFKTLLHDLMTAKRRLSGQVVARFEQEEITP